MDSIFDQEFGTVRIRRVARAKYIRLRVRHDGSLSLTLPPRTGIGPATTLIDESRGSIRGLLVKRPPVKQWSHGAQIGATHRLVLQVSEYVEGYKTTVQGNRAIVRHHPDIDRTELQLAIHSLVVRLLRKQAMAYLPRRLAGLAAAHGFTYGGVRFSNAETRWGSCSSSGTISMNIWLMTLPLDIVDYVLLHELAHTKHMNHSQAFWRALAACVPDYAVLRKRLKQYNPMP